MEIVAAGVAFAGNFRRKGKSRVFLDRKCINICTDRKDGSLFCTVDKSDDSCGISVRMVFNTGIIENFFDEFCCLNSEGACTPPDTSKSPPAAYCFSQLKQGTYLIRLKWMLSKNPPVGITGGFQGLWIIQGRRSKLQLCRSRM